MINLQKLLWWRREPPDSETQVPPKELIAYSRDYLIAVFIYCIFFVGALMIGAFRFREMFSAPSSSIFAIMFGAIGIGVGFVGIKHSLVISYRLKHVLRNVGREDGFLFTIISNSLWKKISLAESHARICYIFLSGRKARIFNIIVFILSWAGFLWGIYKYITYFKTPS